MLEFEHPLPPPGATEAACLVFSGTIALPGTAETIWPLIEDYTGWQDFSKAEPISGTPGAVREVVLLKKEEPGLETFPPYYARTMKVERPRQIVWKTFPQRRSGTDPTFFGIVDFRLDPRGAQCDFTYNVYYEFVVDMTDDAKVAAYEAEMTAGFQQLFASAFPKLIKLCKAAQRAGEG